MSKKQKNSKSKIAKSRPRKVSDEPQHAARPGPTLGRATTPDPKVLTIATHYDRAVAKWSWSVRENKTEHYTSPEEFETEETAKADGDKWLARYTKARDKGRRAFLGWKSADGSPEADDKTSSPTSGPRTKATHGLPAKEKRPSGLDAAAQVLQASGAPMRCKDLVQTMLDQKLWATGGKTPAATIYSAILREIRDKGATSRFKKTDRGLFTFVPGSGSVAPESSGTPTTPASPAPKTSKAKKGKKG